MNKKEKGKLKLINDEWVVKSEDIGVFKLRKEDVEKYDKFLKSIDPKNQGMDMEFSLEKGEGQLNYFARLLDVTPPKFEEEIVEEEKFVEPKSEPIVDMPEELIEKIQEAERVIDVIIDDMPKPEPIVYDEKEILESRQLTFGEKLVGFSFNPSGDKDVQRAKQLCAELADLLKNVRTRKKQEAHQNKKDDVIANEYIDDITLEYNIYTQALGEILTAQMFVVKSLTYKM